jgi:hypothetical protein
MSREIVYLKRDELYEAVWKEPVQTWLRSTESAAPRSGRFAESCGGLCRLGAIG